MPANWSQHVAPPSPIPIERFRSPPITGPCWSFIEEISGASHLISGTATNFNFSAGVFYFRNGYMNINPLKNHRILVIDDDIAIHEDFQKILITASHFPQPKRRCSIAASG